MLESDFQFHQSNLQDFTDCRRRFYLRSVQRLAWPSVEAEPVLEHERSMLLGVQFHRMVHQSFLGIPAERLVQTVHDPELMVWWEDFLRWRGSEAAQVLDEPGVKISPEVQLTVPLEGYRLAAKLDLLVITEDGRFYIYDWKTGGKSERAKRRRWLTTRLQTRVYPLVVSRAGAALGSAAEIPAANVSMTYWFAGSTEPEEVFTYSEEQQAQDDALIRREIGLIIRLSGPGDFPLTNDVRQCRFCVYRSLCERGEKAASIVEDEYETAGADLSPVFDFGSIEEVYPGEE